MCVPVISGYGTAVPAVINESALRSLAEKGVYFLKCIRMLKRATTLVLGVVQPGTSLKPWTGQLPEGSAMASTAHPAACTMVLGPEHCCLALLALKARASLPPSR